MMEYELIRSERRSLSLELRADGSLLVRAPRRLPPSEIAAFVESRGQWIAQKRALLQQGQECCGGPPLTAAELAALKQAAAADLPARVERWAGRIGVQPQGLTLRTQRRRWGSCSGRGRISLNALLMLAPEAVRDYVVVHELCHLRELNHSPRFWQEVAQALPEYGAAQAWLKQNGLALLQRQAK